MPSTGLRLLFAVLISALLADVSYSAHPIYDEKEAGKTTYYLQMAAFSKQASAERYGRDLSQRSQKKIRIKTYSKDRDTPLYLVQIGPLDTRPMARAIEKALMKPQAKAKTPSSSSHLASKLPSIALNKSVKQAKPKAVASAKRAATTTRNSRQAVKKTAERAETPQPTKPTTALKNFQKQPLAKPVKLASLNSGSSPKLAQTPQINPNYQLSKRPLVEARTWNLRNANIRSVIAEVARETGKNFVIDPRVQGKVSIISDKAITPKEVYQVFLAMLQVSGYAAIPAGKITKIVPNIEAKTQGGDALSRLRPAKGDEMVVKVLPVKYVPAEQLVPVLRPLMPQWSNISAYAPSNMVILTGRADNITRLTNIIKEVDTPDSNGIDIVPLHNALAMDVVTTLKALVGNQRTGSQHKQAMVAADDRSNSILVSGSKTERLRYKVLIRQLDTQSPSGTSGNTQVIYLHYLRAEDLVPILAGIAQANFSGSVGTTIGTITIPTLDRTSPVSSDGSGVGGVSNSSSLGSMASTSSSYSGAGSSSDAAANTQATTSSSEGDNKPKVQLIAEPSTNSVIVNAPPMLMRTLKTVIRQLDIRPAQILIEALIAEIDEDNVNELGIEWGMKGAIDVDANGARTSIAPTIPGQAIINSQTKIDDFQATLYGLIQDKKANLLSTPSVVVLDNRQAKILVGKQVSVQESSYPNNAGGTTDATPYNTFSRMNVALHLYVRPQISRGKTIQLQIDHGNDTLANPLQADSTTPEVNTSSIITTVLINSGDILVLGGLTQNSLQHTGDALPILGDIPGIGEFFQYNKRQRQKKVLMVFIRPIILLNKQIGMQVSGAKYNDIRKHQLKWLNEQPYNPDNKDLLLKNLDPVRLPIPFSKDNALHNYG